MATRKRRSHGSFGVRCPVEKVEQVNRVDLCLLPCVSKLGFEKECVLWTLFFFCKSFSICLNFTTGPGMGDGWEILGLFVI
uniref:Uncharacterized protein n=1 Tax=Anguilla anguilla TaxID=7936 RepID=A0A0E9WQR7_ANGAN